MSLFFAFKSSMISLKTGLIFLALIVAMSLQAGRSWAGSNSSSENELQNFYHSNSSEQKSLEFYLHYFLNKRSPYLVNPLGEGVEGPYSSGPLYRFDGFDCTTFVETVLALTLSRTPEEFKTKINLIRYKEGRVAYEARNHFPSTDWIPNNTRAGVVKDITSEIANADTRVSVTWIEKDEWARMKGEDFHKMSLGFKKEWGRIPYLGKEEILAQPSLLERIPSGAIFHVVRPNWDLKKAIGTQLDVSHQGFLLREEGVLYMYHASNGVRDGSSDYKGVKREPLLEYVERVMKKSPSMAGLNILQIQTP